MIKNQLIVLFVISLLLPGNSLFANQVTFSGVGIIFTGWREVEDPEYTVETTISVVNITQISTQQKVTPKNISWEVYDYQGDYLQEINETSITLSRESWHPRTINYSVTVWVDESFGEVEFTLSRTLTLHPPTFTIPPGTTVTIIDEGLGVLPIVLIVVGSVLSVVAIVVVLIVFLNKRRRIKET
ncbi:MAG: hypothetical protein GF308_14675 [Candidatus Heimdallarchaeota archaeon]|nr:hypothetical protein [Candidatus Heimdallarchaeota archaeon]